MRRLQLTRLGAGAALAVACSTCAGGDRATVGTVVLDTGHTKQRPGSTSANGRPEFAYNLALSNRIAEELDAAGVAVKRVAADGREVALTARTADTRGATVFVSIHHDAIQQEWVDQGRGGEFSGFSVFVSAKNAHPRESMACAQMVGDGLVRAGEKPSLYHATPIKGENRQLLDEARGVHRFDDLVVLKTAMSPALLIEAGVIVNPTEAVRLAQTQTVDRLGRQIAAAVVACVRAGK